MPANSTDEVRKKQKGKKERPNAGERERGGGGITNSWICLSGEDGNEKKKKMKKKKKKRSSRRGFMVKTVFVVYYKV